ADEVDRVKPVSVDVSAGEGSGNNDYENPIATLGSTDETYTEENVKSTVLSDTDSEYKGEDFHKFGSVFESPKVDTQTSSKGESSGLRVYARKSGIKSKLPSKFSDFVLDKNVKYGIEKHVNYSNLSKNNYVFSTSLNKIHEPKTYEEACEDSRYCLELLTEFGILACKPTDIPVSDKVTLKKGNVCADIDEPLVGVNNYQKLVGSLRSAFKVLRYLKGSPGLGLKFKPGKSLDLDVYVDSDWRRCKRESKARTTLLQSIPDDHVADFHYMDDARDIWNAVKARFGGNVESKKIRKSMLKQEFLEFRIGEAEGLELLSFDDSYYKLKTLKVDVKGYTTFSSSQSACPSHSAFVSTTSASKKMSYGDSPSYCSTTTYTAPSNSKIGSHRSGNVIEDVLQSFVADTKPEQQLAYKDFEQIEKLHLEEMDLKWQMDMLSVRVHKFEQKDGRKIDFDKKESARFNKKKVRCYKCQQRGHFARECRAKRGNDKQRYSSFKIKEIGKKEEDSKALITVETLVDWTDHDGESDGVIAAKEFGMIAGCDTEDAIKEGRPLFNRFAKADSMKVVPLPLSRDYTSLSDHIDLDESQMSYGIKSSTSSDSKSVSNDFVSCDDSDKSSEVNTNDFASSDSSVKSPSQMILPHVHQLPVGTHLIKDCDFYEKQMVNKTVGIGVGPVHSRNKVNHQNQFVPQAIVFRTGKVNIPPARPQPVPTGKPKVFAPVHTGRQNRPFPVHTDRGYSPSVIFGWWISTARPMPHFSRPTSSYFQTYIPYVPTMYYNHMKYSGDRWATVVKPSAGCSWKSHRKAYSDSDYAGANKDRKSTTDGCQFLGRSLISWQCKKQTIVATSSTEAEYVVAANCYGQPNGSRGSSVLADVPTSANVPTSSTSVPADVPTSVATAGVSNKGKTLMVEEDITVKERTFKQMKDNRLREQAAKRLHDEEQAQVDRQRAELQRRRQQEVLASAMYYTGADWINIMAQVEANASLSKTLMGDDVSEDNFPARMAALIKRKKQALAEKLPKEMMDRPMTQGQQRTYMRHFIQKALSNIQIQAFSMNLKRTGPVLEEPSSKRQKSTESPIPSVPEVPQSPVVSSPKSFGTRWKSLGRNHLTKPKSKIKELDLDADDQTFIKVVSNEDSKDEAPLLWSAFVGWEVITTLLGDINALYRIDWSTAHFTTLREILHMVDRQDLLTLYGLVGDLQVLFDSHEGGKGSFVWHHQHLWQIRSWRLYTLLNVHVLETVSGEVVYMFADVSFPFSVKLMERMLKHKLEIDKDVVGNDMTTAEQLIQFIKNQLVAAQAVKIDLEWDPTGNKKACNWFCCVSGRRSCVLEKQKTVLVPLHCDNNVAIRIAANPVFHEKTKHFELDLYFLREKIHEGFVKTEKVKSADNIADVFTKGLSVKEHKFFCGKLGLLDLYKN
nr:ribonuclease H-like domain-containing protein [Tanacetum cinerariifolium]